MAEHLVAAASATLADCTVTATATVEEAVTAAGSVSTAFYDATINWVLKKSTIVGFAIAGIAIVGYEIVDI